MRVVVKIGSSSLTREDGRLRDDVVGPVADQIAAARAEGHEVLLVTSGAVASGVAGLGLGSRPSDVLTLQAVSAVGQPRLMAAYDEAFSRHGIVAAQVLLVAHDFVERQQYLHARDTLVRLLELGCVPVVNENDAVASNEIRYGDNDRLAALLSHMAGADMLLLLTDTAGLHTADPRTDATATVVPVVAADDPLLAVTTGGAGSARGSGGMSSKLAAARIASWSGVPTVIASADRPGVLRDAIAGADVGTRFLAHDRQLSARRLWVAFAAEVEGSVAVDEGARRALVERGTSLLPAGTTGCDGEFEVGAVVDIVGPDGAVVARGIAAMSSVQVASNLGRRSADLENTASREVAHRDDLVVLVGA